MKILILAFHPRYMTPYSQQYENAIRASNEEYDILFWDRFSNAPLQKNGNEYIFHEKCSLGGSKILKVFSMYKYRKNVIAILKSNIYDKIIVLNTLPAILLSDILLNDYKNKYIFDIRDYTYEKYKLYKYRVDCLIENSFFTSISSKGFMSFLAKNKKIYLNHNISNVEKGDKFKIVDISKKEKINIGFIGVQRYEKENKWLINSFRNSNIVLLSYIGRKYPDIDFEGYCNRKKIKNCFFKGEFCNEDKPELYKNIDMINAIYGNESLEVITALPNKLYDALIFKKPIIASKGTYLGEIVKKNNLGFTVEVGDDIKTILEKYRKNFSIELFDSSIKEMLANIVIDQLKIENKLIEFTHI